jgi:D-inositol-3-phosphate glycosyltransferase
MTSARREQGRQPRRIAMLSVHTSPLEQPGTGDAGGMNVYVAETARRLAERGTEVEIFTRATSGTSLGTVELAPGVLVRHVVAGPFEGLSKNDLPGQLCAFASGVLRVEAQHEAGWYDLVHSHYWLSGQVGWLTADRWHVPLVHSMHTMAKVKNRMLAEGDTPEPRGRVIGEEQVVVAADQLVANTDREARELVDLYAADPGRVCVVPPGVDLDVFAPRACGGRLAARRRLGLPLDGDVLLFVGRIQPLKAPDVLVLGGPSGTGLEKPRALQDLAASLGVADVVSFRPPTHRVELADWYRAADVVAVPSHSESFGLVAVEAQACGTPVVAARVGGLPTAVTDGVTGVLVDGHDPKDWARVLVGLLDEPLRRRRMGAAAAVAATRYGWDSTVDALLGVYGDALADRFPRSPAVRRGPVPLPVGDLAVAP